MPKEQEQGEQQALPQFLVEAILNFWTEHFQRVRGLIQISQYLQPQQQPVPRVVAWRWAEQRADGAERQAARLCGIGVVVSGEGGGCGGDGF